MSCKNCDKATPITYRWGSANISIISCQEHFKEIANALSVVQSYGQEQLTEKIDFLNRLDDAKAIFGGEFPNWLMQNLPDVYSLWYKSKEELEKNEKNKA